MSDTTKPNGANELVVDVVAETHPRSVRVITGAIPIAILRQYRPKTLKRLAAQTRIPGFRLGHVPPSVIEKRMQETELMRELAAEVLADAYPALLQAHAPNMLGTPRVAVTDVVPEKHALFSIEVAVMPTFSLPDYRALARTHITAPTPEILVVSDDEIEKIIANVRAREARVALHRMHPDAGYEHRDIPEDEWPAFTDEMVRSLGDFKDVSDFKEKMRAQLAKEKEMQFREQGLTKYIDTIIAETALDIPVVLVESELELIREEFTGWLHRAGLTFSGYLTHIGKTEEEILPTWREEASRRAKLQLILSAIADAETLMPKPETVDREVAHLMEHYPEADEARVRAHAIKHLRNKLVLKFLEEMIKQ